jgi:ABC-2 type transport system permease protein
MNDIVTVLRKEYLELFGNRHAARGPLIQSAVMLLMTGVLLPSSGAFRWMASPTTPLLYFMFPSALAAVIAADSFAGERERRTLETLLATPLSDAAIFVGKVASAALFAVTVTLLSLIAAVVTINLGQHDGAFFLPPVELALGVLGSAAGASLVTAAVAVAISMRVTVARSAQQMSSMLSMAIVGAVAFALGQLGLSLTWPVILRIDLLVGAVGVLALVVAQKAFRRERFFDAR